MSNLSTVNIEFSTSHYFFPKIIIGVLVIFGVIILIQTIIEKSRDKKNGVEKEKFRFFAEGFDKLKLFGSIGLLIAYVACLKLLGFLIASIIFIFLFNLLFTSSLKMKNLGVSAAISLVSSGLVWYLFGVVFNITLP